MKTLSYALYTVGGCIGATLGMHYILFIFLTSVMLFDTVTGVAKGVRLKSFSSSRLTRGIISKVFVLTLILIFGAGSHQIFPMITWDDTMLGLMIGMLCIAELISTIQNILVVRTGQAIKEYDAVSYVLHRLLDILRGKLENMKQ